MGQSYGDQNAQEKLETSQPMTKTTQSVWFALITESQDPVSNMILSFVVLKSYLQKPLTAAGSLPHSKMTV